MHAHRIHYMDDKMKIAFEMQSEYENFMFAPVSH